jgi:uncharacterized BrkB/YihY/UPF0761 family membrane protein
MKLADDLLDRADALQRHWPPAPFAVAVWKKFSDDRARDLAGLIAFYAFVSIFPLLLALVTVLDLVLRYDLALRQKLLDSALTAYPVIGTQIKNSVHPLTSTGLALAAGLIVALFGARGVARAIQHALNSVWAVPIDRRPEFPASVLRGIGLIVVIGLGQIITASLSSLAVGAGHAAVAAQPAPAADRAGRASSRALRPGRAAPASRHNGARFVAGAHAGLTVSRRQQ